MRRRIRAAPLLCASLALFWSGLGAPGPAKCQTAQKVLRLAMTSGPNSLNPLLNTRLNENRLARLMLDPLVEADFRGTMKPVPALAVPTQQNGGISADGKTITYKLRRDVKWQDATPFTSADFAFTYRAYVNPRNNIAGIAPL